MTRGAYYFKRDMRLQDNGETPPPLEFSVTRVARFDEIDPLGVVWHGRYASYFEDARVALGNYYGFSYQDMLKASIVAPIRQIHMDFTASLRFEQECRITARLFWNEAARLDFEYAIQAAPDGALLTRGYTVQLFLTAAGELCLGKPDCYEAFCARWKAGELPGPVAG